MVFPLYRQVALKGSGPCGVFLDCQWEVLIGIDYLSSSLADLGNCGSTGSGTGSSPHSFCRRSQIGSSW